MAVIFEPFKIKSVEPIALTTVDERKKLLDDAHFNLFLVPAGSVTFDLLTDSGTSAMSDAQWSAMLRADESYAGSKSYWRFKFKAKDLTGYEHIIPTHQGRAAERILFQCAVTRGQRVPSNNHFDTTRANIEFGGAFKVAGKPVVIKVGHEVLEGNGINALQTPFATVHAFNGWADKFVGAPGGSGTPVGGLEDTSATVVVKGLWGPSKLVFQYHDYQADTVVGGVDDYGDEWGVLFAKPFPKHWQP